MKFRSGVAVGLVAGYVLGARAGRERYEQIKRGAVAARRHPAVAQIGRQMTGLSDFARNGVAGGLEAGSQRLRDVAEEQAASIPQEVNARRT